MREVVSKRVLALAIACAAVVVFFARSALALNAHDAAYEAKLRDRVAGLNADAVAAWDRGNQAREAEDRKTAQAAYEEVIAKLPDFDPAYRRLCSVQDGDTAIASCRHAISIADTWENEAALSTVLLRTHGDPNEARTLADSAESKAPHEVSVLMLQTQISIATNDDQRFMRYADRLETEFPGDPTHAVVDAIAALARGDAPKARAALARGTAAKTIDPENAKHIAAAIDGYEHRWTPAKVAKAFGLAIVIWLLFAAFLFGAGTMLSRATLRATVVAKEGAAADPNVAIGGTRTLKRAYAALIAAASVFYYVSLPLVAALVLVGMAAVAYATLAVGQVPIKLVLIVVLVGGASLWAILKGMWVTLRPPKAKDPGDEIRLAEHPKLAALLSSIAARIGTRTVDRIFLTPHTDMAVFERGGVLATSRGRGERCLILGAGLLRGMRVGSLKGVLAHEFGHFKNEDTAGGALSLAVRRSMLQMLVALIQSGAAKIYNPAWQFATRYHGIFLRISQGASRLQEVLADRWAVAAYGSRPFVDGFEHVIARSVEHEARIQFTLKDVLSNDRPLLNLFTHEAALDPDALVKEQREARDRDPDPFDSHPPPKDRIAAALALAVVHEPEPGDEDDAWHLFEGRDALEQLLTDRVCAIVAANHAVRIRRAPAPPSGP